MSLIFNLIIALCLNLSAQADANCSDNFEEMMRLSEKINYLMEAMEKLEEKNFNLEKKNLDLENEIEKIKTKDSKFERQMDMLNETVVVHSKVETKLKELIEVVETKVRENVNELQKNDEQIKTENEKLINQKVEKAEQEMNWKLKKLQDKDLDLDKNHLDLKSQVNVLHKAIAIQPQKFKDMIKVVETKVRENVNELQKNNELIKTENQKLINQKVGKVKEEMNWKSTLMNQRLSERVWNLGEKMEEHVSGLKVKLGKVEQRINWLNETVERVSSVTKINSNNIDSIGQHLNISFNRGGSSEVEAPKREWFKKFKHKVQKTFGSPETN